MRDLRSPRSGSDPASVLSDAMPRRPAIGKWRSAEARQGNDAFLARLGRDLNRSGANYARNSVRCCGRRLDLVVIRRERRAQIKMRHAIAAIVVSAIGGMNVGRVGQKTPIA